MMTVMASVSGVVSDCACLARRSGVDGGASGPATRSGCVTDVEASESAVCHRCTHGTRQDTTDSG